MEQLFLSFATQYPAVVLVLTVIGVLRAINKPLFALLHSFAEATPTDVDNKVLETVEKSKAYSYAMFLLDYLASVKVPVKDVTPKAP